MCCSIIGYYSYGKKAAPVLVQGLKRMEYRGYDSVGVATLDIGNSKKKEDEKPNSIIVRKGIGKVSEVNNSAKLDRLPGRMGIGHTRWATHGKVTDANAHPHTSSIGQIAIVHNGIIENFEEIKNELIQDGYVFKSETDTEAIANLLQKNYNQTKDVKESIIQTVARLQGEYTFVAMFEDGRLAAARLHKPLILGIGEENIFLASDVLGFIEYTDNAVYVENGNVVIINKDTTAFEMLDFDGSPVKYEITKVSKEFGDAYKGEYAYFTEKEINEQHETVIKAGQLTESEITRAAKAIKDASGAIYLTGSGSSYNAALIAKHFLSKQARIGAEVIMASEMQFASEGIGKGSVLVAISQSGESADVLNAIRIAKKAGCDTVISVVNIMTSSLVHESDICIGMNCGLEIGVAATKSFTSQLVVFYKIISQIISRNNKSSLDQYTDHQGKQDQFCAHDNGDEKNNIRYMSKLIRQILKHPTKIQKVARELKDVSDIYILGRGVHYPIAVEAALKIKELTYIHAEGIAGGELKHGPLALMDSNVYVIIINPNDYTYEDTLTSAREIKARGANIIGISDIKSDIYDHWIEIPKIDRKLNGNKSPIYAVLEIIPVQILAYYVALEKDTDPDYPRNLAKSVTVK